MNTQNIKLSRPELFDVIDKFLVGETYQLRIDHCIINCYSFYIDSAYDLDNNVGFCIIDSGYTYNNMSISKLPNIRTEYIDLYDKMLAIKESFHKNMSGNIIIHHQDKIYINDLMVSSTTTHETVI